MKPHRPMLRAALLAILVAVASSAQPTTPEHSEAQAAGPLRMSRVKAAVDALVTKYRISDREALRRLELQRYAYPLHDRLATRFPGTYSGMWLDQENGGRLVVGATRPEAIVRALATAPDRAHIRVVKKARTLRDLQIVQRRVWTKLGNASLKNGMDVGVDTQNNTVAVRSPDHLTAQHRASLGEPDAAVSIRGYGEKELKSGTSARPYGDVDCGPLACDPPMRGGIRLDIERDDRTWGGCTSGFNLTGDNGWAYLLIAAHCVRGKYHERADNTFHNGLPVGSEVVNGRTAAVIDATWDYAIVPYTVLGGDSWAGYWLYDRWGKNRVVEFTDCAKDSSAGNTAWKCDFYARFMSGVEDNVIPGSMVCATGSATGGPLGTGAPVDRAPGTRCGPADYPGIIATTAAICSAPGDSGGPLYEPTTDRAIGILHNGDPAVPGDTCKSPGTSTYYNASFILERTPIDHGRTFTLNTEF